MCQQKEAYRKSASASQTMPLPVEGLARNVWFFWCLGLVLTTRRTKIAFASQEGRYDDDCPGTILAVSW